MVHVIHFRKQQWIWFVQWKYFHNPHGSSASTFILCERLPDSYDITITFSLLLLSFLPGSTGISDSPRGNWTLGNLILRQTLLLYCVLWVEALQNQVI